MLKSLGKVHTVNRFLWLIR